MVFAPLAIPDSLIGERSSPLRLSALSVHPVKHEFLDTYLSYQLGGRFVTPKSSSDKENWSLPSSCSKYGYCALFEHGNSGGAVLSDSPCALA